MPNSWEKVDMCIRHYNLALKYNGEYNAVREMRKHSAWYIRGLPKCTEIKNKINLENDSLKVLKILSEYKSILKENYK